MSPVRERQDVRKAGAVAALGGAAIVLPFAAPADAMPAACACGGGGAAPAPDPKPTEHQGLAPAPEASPPAPVQPAPPPPPPDPKPFEHQALRPEPVPEPEPEPAPEPAPAPPPDPKPFEHQALRPKPEPEPEPPTPADPKPFEHQALRPEPAPEPQPSATPAPDPKRFEHQALQPEPAPEPKPTPPEPDPKPYEHLALAPTPPTAPKPHEHVALAPTPPDPERDGWFGRLSELFFGEDGPPEPPEPPPPGMTVEEPVEVAPQTDENFLEPWTRVGMTEDEWRDLEDEVLDEACPDGWQGVVFGCSVGGLTLNEEGALEPVEILENGVGSALGRLARWASGAKALPPVGRALTNVSTRLPLSLKNTLVARGVLQSPATRLPAYTGGRTHGIVDFGFEEVARVSGRAGPAASMPSGSRGFDAYFRTHVEGHAVAEMIQRGIPRATVYINQAAPCAGTCMRMIARALPAGYELRVVGSTGRIYTFTGSG